MAHLLFLSLFASLPPLQHCGRHWGSTHFEEDYFKTKGGKWSMFAFVMI